MRAVTDRVLWENDGAFKGCKEAEIKPRGLNTSDLMLTQILDNDEDKHSYLFEDENSVTM